MFSAIIRQTNAVVRKIPSNAIRNVSVGPIVLSEEKIVHFDDSTEPRIPDYVINEQESLKVRKARLMYQSRKRGMLENDLLLSTFAAKYLDGMSEEQAILYDRLINIPSNDWDIYYWAVGHKPTPAEYNNEVMDLFKKHVENKDKLSRIRQPNLY